ncbi:MAG: phosphoenolpyruvate synthase [Thermodesulfobacteria bacterium]|nr:phosphoenolpyruvate synthase [Thermodesulfobacteriota bacterium]
MEGFTSKALLANLACTFVEEVKYDPKYNIFLDIYTKFPALKKQIESILKEVFHPYKNDFIVLDEFRSFFLKNLSILLKHSYRVQGFWLIFDILFKFFNENQTINVRTAEVIFSILEKTAEVCTTDIFYEIIPIFKEVLRAIVNLPDEYFLKFLDNYYSFKKLIKKLLKLHYSQELEDVYKDILKRSYTLTYQVWQKFIQKVEPTLKQILACFDEEFLISSEYFSRLLKELEEDRSLEELLKYPDHLELLKQVKELIQKVSRLEEPIVADELKIKFYFELIEAPVLRLLHEELIREVNRTLILLIESKPSQGLDEFIKKFFRILKEKLHYYPWTALECIKNIGICILKNREVYLIEVLINEIIKFGFQPPQVRGIDIRWKIKQNVNHLLNIRVWLEIFKVNPEWCSSLLAALILNLRLYGVAIKDTDLFQKDVTQLLNANIKPVYNLVKQFCKVLPVFYNEIGAEGKIRDISTEVDELFHRKDSLIYFLRKLVHIENSSLAVEFIKDILNYWWHLDPKYIKRYIPDELFERIVSEERHFAEEVNEILKKLEEKGFVKGVDELILVGLERLKEVLKEIPGNEVVKRKLYLMVHLYKLEHQKYFGILDDLESFVTQYKTSFPFVEELESVLKEEKENYRKAEKLIEWLTSLKDIILSPKKFTPVEEILFKRHVAVDIPSMYGRYREKKFDALGLSFRLEYILNHLLGKIVEDFELKFITKAAFFRIFKVLKLFRKALEIDGIFSQKFDIYLNLLESSLKSYPLSFSQYLDIFKGLIDGVQHIVKVYYVNPYLKVFPMVFYSLKKEELLEKYRGCFEGLETHQQYFCISEVVIRDIVDSALALKHLDTFLKKVYSTMLNYIEKIDKEDLNLLMSYDPKRTVSFIHQPNKMVNDLLYLGNKGYNLILIANEKAIKVKIPYGFVLTTEVFRCYRLIKKYEELFLDYKAKVEENIKLLESLSGRSFGGRERPLLLSVRSGSAISMPGMMNSILNVGINEDVVEGLVEETGNLWFAWDTYRRFVQSWAMAQGVQRDFFNQLMRAHKRKYGVKKKREFTGEQMKELALIYKKAVENLGINIPSDPWEQLYKGIELTIKSWSNEKAKSYREIMQIASEWGTAVIVQQMVFGNRSMQAGTGVTLTTSPVGKFPRIILWGDYTPYNQGEDIVSGLVNAYPISVEQKKIEGRDGPSLEEAFPEIYKNLLDFVYYLVYEKGWGHQEIEFTFESEKAEDLYILQVRDIILREEKLEFFDAQMLDKLECIGKGIGVCGGVVSGRIVFTLEDIERFKDKGDPLILLRYDTVPDNIKEISMVAGILTARGGQTSHAAIVASRLGKICVVGCENLSIDEFNKEARLNGVRLKLGEWITLNGLTGQVFKGRLKPAELTLEH